VNSAVIQIADGIVQAINSGPGYSQPVTAVRSYRARFELRDLGALKVVGVPATWQLEPFDRTHDGLTIRTDIGVLKKLTSAEGTPELQAEMDGLCQLVSEIAQRLRRRRLEIALEHSWVGLAMEPGFEPEAFVQRREFISILQVTYRVRSSA